MSTIVSDRLTEHRALSNRATFALGLLLAFMVLGPVIGKGWLLQLDWVLGPDASVTKPMLALESGPLAGVPALFFLSAAARVAGSSTTLLPILAAVAIAGPSMASLVGGPGSRRAPAALLYVINPFVFERLAVGHVTILVGYALLPLGLRVVLAGIRARRTTGFVLWTVAVMALSVHFGFIAGVIAASGVAAARCSRGIRWLAIATVGVVVANAYLIGAALAADAIDVGSDDLAAYGTSADRRLGLYVNVAGLYGFWRQSAASLPKDVLPGWPFLLLAIVLVVCIGARSAWRKDETRLLARTVAIAGAAGYFLALGEQGPTGWFFRWMFDNVPGFAVMREPQKFIILVALAYAVLFGFGVEHLVSPLPSKRAATAMLAVGCALPILYTPNLFWGLGGQIKPSHYPQSWYEADRLMDDGDGRALFLPWHQYMSFPFTGRVIGNPADHFFKRDVIVGDNVELPNIETSSTSPRSAYLEFLFDHGGELCAFGDLLAPLGVEYVVLSHTVDWERYQWLDRQVDLNPVMERDDLTVYRNERYRGPGFRGGEPARARHLGDVVDLSASGTLSSRPVLVDRAEPGPITATTCEGTAPRPRGKGSVTRPSIVHYEAPPGDGRWLVVPEPFDEGWQADGRLPRAVAGGVNGYVVPRGEVHVRFTTLRRVIAGYAISGLTVVVLAIVAIRQWRRDRISRDRPPSDLSAFVPE